MSRKSDQAKQTQQFLAQSNQRNLALSGDLWRSYGLAYGKKNTEDDRRRDHKLHKHLVKDVFEHKDFPQSETCQAQQHVVSVLLREIQIAHLKNQQANAIQLSKVLRQVLEQECGKDAAKLFAKQARESRESLDKDEEADYNTQAELMAMKRAQWESSASLSEQSVQPSIPSLSLM